MKKALLGRTVPQKREAVASVAQKQGVSLEELFERAAKEHAPFTTPKDLMRKVMRFGQDERNEPPDFVARYVQGALRARPSASA